MTVWHIRIACWLTKATNTHTHTHTQNMCNTSFPLQQWLHERVSVLRYTYTACLVKVLRMKCS